ncbi:MAG: bifunctional demethylmenaquinone methyltransferase/2-methoxy-6-polyprenyl-1,4-benzoquinol methylase UbiE [Odoribacteraceae bacterium]|jgi:demethylmenaquinone methyltransferase/2-methoxy-6-polyprenyl-1,4-benzoquinol methylase|nr:bifunctional demethylmenaquinone methyltransferase/2-methoxy-6-polyprenyl-1,4-benzoquinol methylase UbiE [Odoribacteraceae bacterium]
MAKKEKVRDMFNDIAPRYDLLNHLLSLGIDKRWRTLAARCLAKGAGVLDVACGTGDFAITAARRGAARVTGVDISEKMLDVARAKARAKHLDHRVSFLQGDAEELHFPDGSFDAVTVAFGARNFERLDKALDEIARVTRPGGRLVILEFSVPERFPVKQLYRFYFTRLLPRVGGIISGRGDAYAYLPASVYPFPRGEKFLDILRAAGFHGATARPLSFGIATLYTAEKPA